MSENVYVLIGRLNKIVDILSARVECLEERLLNSEAEFSRKLEKELYSLSKGKEDSFRDRYEVLARFITDGVEGNCKNIKPKKHTLKMEE